MDEARARGVDVTTDAYPYTASSTSIQGALFPAWAQEGGRKQVLARLADPAVRPKVKADIVRVIMNERGGGDPRNIVVASCEWDATLAGKNLTDVTKIRGLHQPLTRPQKLRYGSCRAAVVMASSTPSARKISSGFSATPRR